jgi:hypothetical protein
MVNAQLVGKQHWYQSTDGLKMIGRYAAGTFPRSKEPIKVARAYERKTANEEWLEKAFEGATIKVEEA